MEFSLKNTQIDELFEMELISVRTLHICEDNYLPDTTAISDYFRINRSFLAFRNCGMKSNLELINVCKIYDKAFLIYEDSDEYLPAQEPDRIQLLDNKQKLILDNTIKFESKKLSKRSFKAMASFLGGEINVNNIEPVLYIQEKEILSLKTVGTDSASELISFRNKLCQYVDYVLGSNDENKLSLELLNSCLQLFFNLKQDTLDNIKEGQDFTNGVPIFKILKVLIEEEKLFNDVENVIFNSCFNFFKNTRISLLDEIGLKFGLKKLSVKRIRLQIFESLLDKFVFLKCMKSDVSRLYRIDLSENFIAIDENLVSRINQSEENNFNIIFITKVLSILYDDRYILIGDEEKCVFGNYTYTSHNWSRLYLIKRHLAFLFDFMKFVENIRVRLSKIKKECSIEFIPYLLKFQKENCEVEIDSIKEIVDYILFNEFELSVSADGYLCLTKYTKSQIEKAVMYALKIKSKLLSIREIYDLISDKYPGIIKDQNRLSEFCKNIPDLVYFENTKTYGLRVWSDATNSSGSTIKDLAAEYLTGKTEPAQIDDVIEYVKNHYYATTEDIQSNLKFNPKKRFVFLRNKYIDLKTKDYITAKYIKNKTETLTENEFEISYNQAITFIQENNRQPSSKGSMFEKTLYRFLTLQTRLLKNGTLSLKNRELFEKTGFHERKILRTKVWMKDYDNLKHFRLVHTDRWPIFQNGILERSLYNFCLKNRWRIRNGKISKYKKNLLKEIDFHLFVPE